MMEKFGSISSPGIGSVESRRPSERGMNRVSPQKLECESQDFQW